MAIKQLVDIDKIKTEANKIATVVMNHEQVKQAKQRFDQLPERDRFALKALSIFAGVMLVVLMVFLPIRHFATSEQQHYQEAKSLLTWMRANEAAARQIAAMTQAGADGQSLLNTINLAAQNRAITIKRIEPEGQSNSSVWLENAPYETVMLWLFDLQEQHKIRVKQITIDKQPNSGYVNVHALFGV